MLPFPFVHRIMSQFLTPWDFVRFGLGFILTLTAIGSFYYHGLAAVLTWISNYIHYKVWNWIKISLKFVPRGPINNIRALVHIMAWRRLGDKPLSEPMMVSLLTHICVTRHQRVQTRITSILNTIAHDRRNQTCIASHKSMPNISHDDS